jgi:transposase-like protein
MVDLRTRLLDDLHLLKHLPGIEQAFVRDYYLKGRTQAEIAREHDISQASVSYRLKSARKRLDFLQKFPVLTAEEVKSSLRSAGFSPEDTKMLATLYKTTCQLTTADKFGVSQGRVRYRLHLAVPRLERLVRKGQKELKGVCTGLRMIRDRTGTLHSYPHWSTAYAAPPLFSRR